MGTYYNTHSRNITVTLDDGTMVSFGRRAKTEVSRELESSRALVQMVSKGLLKRLPDPPPVAEPAPKQVAPEKGEDKSVDETPVKRSETKTKKQSSSSKLSSSSSKVTVPDEKKKSADEEVTAETVEEDPVQESPKSTSKKSSTSKRSSSSKKTGSKKTSKKTSKKSS